MNPFNEVSEMLFLFSNVYRSFQSRLGLFSQWNRVGIFRSPARDIPGMVISPVGTECWHEIKMFVCAMFPFQSYRAQRN